MATESHQTTTTLQETKKSTNVTNTDKTIKESNQGGNTTPTSSNRSDKYSKTTHQINKTTSKSKTTHLLSSQPRFSTTEILQKFPQIQHRYCHKLKISIPWDDKDNLPTPTTYYKSIHYFYTLVKKFDPRFQILTWDIVNKQCNNISSIDQLPKTHHELSSYLYNVHMTPSRVRTSMVVTSSYNLGDLARSQYKGDNVHIDLLKTFRKEKLWVQPTAIQTMGEVKLIGFLQFVHPKFTNLKKLAIELQAIVETRDIVVEIYRPRALDENGSIITAPEAIAIGAPSDISVSVYKSLIDKWSSVLEGHYDMVIGKDSILKMGYFIPFANGVLNQHDKNDAIISHEAFLKEFTSIKIRQCSSVDMRFQISRSEMSILDLTGKHKTNDEMINTTLRRIMKSWRNEDDPDYLIQSIEPANMNTQLLVVKKNDKGTILTKLHLLMDTLKRRKDFAVICGNTNGQGAHVDKFIFTKRGHNYLTYLKGIVRSGDTHQNDTSETSSDTDRIVKLDGKRKLQQLRPTSTASHMSQPLISPVYKKSTTPISTETNTSTPVTLPGKQTNCLKDTTSLSDVQNSTVPSTVPDNSMTTISTTDTPPTTYSKIVQREASMTSAGHITNSNVIEIESSQPQQPPAAMVPYVHVPSTELTLSTITSEHRQVELSQTPDLITRLSDSQVHDITLAVSAKYDIAMKRMQDSYDAQIQNLAITQQSQKSEINEIKASQKELKSDIDKSVNDKFDKHTEMFSSLIHMIKDMKSADEKYREQVHSQSATSSISATNGYPKKDSLSLSDNDISYSEDDSDNVQSSDIPQQEDKTIPSSNRSDQRKTIVSISTSTGDTITDRCCNKNECIAGKLCKQKHTNQIPEAASTDIRCATLSRPLNPSLVYQEEGWNNITSTMRKAVKIKHALISPAKPVKNSSNTTNSPNYNRYIPNESQQRRSNRLRTASSKTEVDHHRNIEQQAGGGPDP